MLSDAVGAQVWNTNGVEGVHRFLSRAWRLFEGGLDSAAEPSPEQLRQLHGTIKRVGLPTRTPGCYQCPLKQFLIAFGNKSDSKCFG